MRRGILASRDELTALRDRIAHRPYTAIHEVLESRCSLILESSPVTEAHWMRSWQQGVYDAAFAAARTAQGRLLDLLIAHHVDPNPAYRDRAAEELRDLASWTTWIDPCHPGKVADLCTAEAAVAAAVGLDWLWEDLSQRDRDRVLEAIRARAIEPYLRGVEEGAVWCDCYHNWNAVINSGCGLAALALADEDDRARTAYGSARENLRHFFDALGREGGWDEGTGYWGFAMRYVLLFAEACRRLLDDESLFHARGMDATGLFPIYFSPNGHAASFGDSPLVPVYGTFYLLVQRYGLEQVAWWLDEYAFHQDVKTSGWSVAGLALLFRPPDVKVPEAPELHPLRVYADIGWAAMADHWPRPELHVAVKNGDLAAHHSQHDMNSIQVQVVGEMLLTDLGGAPAGGEYAAEEREDGYEAEAAAHNTILVAERDHQIDAHGEFLASADGDEYRWVASDAGTACGESVRFVRHVVLLKGPGVNDRGEAVVVLDEITNGVPERIDLLWHTRGEVELEPETLRGVLTGQRSEVHFACGGTVKLRAWTEVRELGPGRSDHLVRFSAGFVGAELLLSVFSTESLPEAPGVVRDEDGGVNVRAGRWSVDFSRGRRCLQLQGARRV